MVSFPLTALLLSLTERPAQDSPDRLDWYWDTPRGHYNTVLAQAESGKMMGVFELALLDNGDLLPILPHSRYTSDAVTTVTDTFVMRSNDGGASWTRSTSK